MVETTRDQSEGPATDRFGNPVIDPTANVTALVEAGMRRQDDLRIALAEHVSEISSLRAAYDQKLREAESARIDAIRTVDVGNVTRAAEVAAAQAATLAAQLETTRIATATSLAAALEPIQKDIAELRKTQYEQAGAKGQQVETRSGNSLNFGYVVGALGIGFAAVETFLRATGH